MENILIVIFVISYTLLPGNQAQVNPYARRIIQRVNAFRSEDWASFDVPGSLANLPDFIQTHPELKPESSIDKNGQCYKEWDYIRSCNFTDVFKFWDSYAVIGTGIAAGHVLFPGQFEECINTKSGYSAIEDPDFPDTDAYLAIFTLKLISSNYFIMGICMPASCSNEEVAVLFKDLINKKSWEPPFHVFAMGRDKFDANAGFIIACVVFGSIAVLVVCATTYTVSIMISERLKANLVSNNENKTNDSVSEETAKKITVEKPLPLRMLLSFDVYTNFCKIMRVPKEASPDQLPCLNGIRVMSLGWVIIGHILLLQLYMMDNALYLIQRSSNFLFQVLSNATPSVDTFFVMSGMLVMLGAMRSLDKLKEGKQTKFWIMFYVHRLIRLWPTLLLTILFVAGIYPNLAPLFYSPFFQNTNPTSSMAKMCQGSNWMSAGFFYSNMVSDPNAACVGWTWYVSNDMQFYVISPLFIVLARLPTKGRLISVLAISFAVAASTLTVLLGSGLNKAPPADTGVTALANPHLYSDFDVSGSWATTKLYFTNYCRFQTYGIGLLLGLAAYDKDWIMKKIDELGFKKVILINGLWALAFAMGGVSIYGCTPYAQGGSMGVWAAAFYNATFRLLWAFFVSILIFFCITGYGGFINDILSSNFWIPLARVNYTTYIIHFVLLEMYFLTLEQDAHFSTISYSLLCCGLLMIINFLSVLCSCFLEAPFITLEKVILGR